MSGHQFRVGIGLRPRVVGWPFGRLTISTEGIEVASLRGRWIKPILLKRGDIEAVDVHRPLGVPVLRIRSVNPSTRSPRIEMPLHAAKILRALRSDGYEVHDLR